MPVARIITTSPAASEALRRQLIAAGYSVKFAAPDEEFSDADIVVAAANVHVDYALQYAAEVAAEADADVIVAPGVAPGSTERLVVPARQEPVPTIQTKPEEATPVAGPLFTATDETNVPRSESGPKIREALTSYGASLGDAWQRFKQERELAAERKRLEREQRVMEREEQRRVLQQKRLEAEAQMAAERERLRAQRQAEQERMRREQEEMRRAMEVERARLAAERERIAATLSPVAAPPAVQAPPATFAPPRPHVPRPVARRPLAATRRPAGRDRRFQRAAFIASVVALVAMVAFAVAMNLHPSAPIPHSMVQNPVQEKSPFGAASITPVTTTNIPAKPAAHAALPQNDAAPAKPPAAKVTKPSPTRTRRARRDNYVAEDEVIIHHYGASTAPKHPPAAQTQAGVRKYTDQD